MVKAQNTRDTAFLPIDFLCPFSVAHLEWAGIPIQVILGNGCRFTVTAPTSTNEMLDKTESLADLKFISPRKKAKSQKVWAKAMAASQSPLFSNWKQLDAQDRHAVTYKFYELRQLACGRQLIKLLVSCAHPYLSLRGTIYDPGYLITCFCLVPKLWDEKMLVLIILAWLTDSDRHSFCKWMNNFKWKHFTPLPCLLHAADRGQKPISCSVT